MKEDRFTLLLRYYHSLSLKSKRKGGRRETWRKRRDRLEKVREKNTDTSFTTIHYESIFEKQ